MLWLGFAWAGPLYDAAQRGDIEAVRQGFEARPDPCDLEAFPSAAFVAELGLTDLVPYLVEQGCDLDQATEKGARPVHLAAVGGHAATLRALLDSGATERMRANGLHWLHFAASGGCIPCLEYGLDERDLPVDLPLERAYPGPDEGVTPLYVAASAGKPEVAVWLIEHGADPWARRRGWEASGTARSSPMDVAATGEDSATLEAMLETGVPPAASAGLAALEDPVPQAIRPPISTGWTPLLEAALAGRLASLKALRAHGASLSDRAESESGQGHSVLTAAAVGAGAEVIEWLLEQSAIDRDATIPVRHLDFENGRLGWQDVSGHGALHVAAAFGNGEAVGALVEAGFDPEAHTAERRGGMGNLLQGFTPLELAARFGHADAVKVLLEAGASPYPHGQPGFVHSPLRDAITWDHAEVVDVLLDGGVLVTPKDAEAARQKPRIMARIERFAYAWFRALGEGATPAPADLEPLGQSTDAGPVVVPQLPLGRSQRWEMDRSGRWLAYGGWGGIQIWDLQVGLLHRWIPDPPTSDGRTFAFAAEGRELLVATWSDKTFSLRRMDVATGEVRASVEETGEVWLHPGMAVGAPHAEGWWLVEPAGRITEFEDDGSMRERLRDARLRRVRTDLTLGDPIALPSPFARAWSVLASDSGRLFLRGAADEGTDELLWWSDTPASGGELWKWEAPGSIEVLSDGSFVRGVATGELVEPGLGPLSPVRGQLEVYEPPRRKPIGIQETVAATSGFRHTVVFVHHPTGGAALSAASTGTISQLVVVAFDDARPPIGRLAPPEWDLSNARFSPDGRWLVVPDSGDAVHRVDLQTGGATTLRPLAAEIPATCTLDREGLLACRGAYADGFAIDLATGESAPAPGREDVGAPSYPLASPIEGLWLRRAGDDVELVESPRGALAEDAPVRCRWAALSVPFHVETYGSRFSEDGRFVVVRGQGLALVDTRSCATAASVYVTGGGEWAVSTGSHTMTSARGGPLVAYRVGATLVPFHAFDLQGNRPDRVVAGLGFGDEETVAALESAWKRRLARNGLTEADLVQTGARPEVAVTRTRPLGQGGETLALDVEARGLALSKLTVRANGVPVASRDLSGTTWSGEIEVPLADGENRIELRVEEATGRTSLPAVVRQPHLRPGASPRVFFVGLGVSDYTRDTLDLEAAAKDVADVEAALDESLAFQEVRTLSLVDGEAVRENLSRVDAFLADATVDDVVVVYLAGHGFLGPEDRFFFGLHDIDPLHPGARGLPFDAIEGWLEATPARRRLVFLDACHAGDPLDSGRQARLPAGTVARSFSFADPLPPPADQEVELSERFADLRNDSGAIVISASGAFAFAIEKSGNGTFTTAVLEALRGEHSTDRGYQLTVRQLQEYVERRVVELTNGLQHPTLRADNLDIDFDLR